MVSTHVVAGVDFILFCFGEVDCRVHLPVHKNVQECIERYLAVVSGYINSGQKVIVWGPHIGPEICSSPFTGSYEERKAITIEFNRSLVERSRGYTFLSIMEDLLVNGCPDSSYYANPNEPGDIHLSQTAMPLALRKFKEASLI